MNILNIICEKINQKPKSKYKIVTFSTHEAYQEAMAKTNHEFYLLEFQNSKRWNEKYRRLPQNCTIVNNLAHLPSDIDILLSQERYTQLQMMLDLSNSTRLPLIHVDHVEPISDENLPRLLNLKADFHVFITEHNKNSWNNDEGFVINHGINTDVFKGWKPNKSKKVIYTVNFLKERDFFCGWKEWEYIKNKVRSIDPSIEFLLVGENPGLSLPINDPSELSMSLRQCACYINTSKYSPIPMSLLEGMSCGMPIVSTKYQQVGTLLNENNSIASNDLDLLVTGVVDICNNNDKYIGMGQNARNDILSKFSMQSFLDNWNGIFERAYNKKLGGTHEIFSIS